MFWDLHRKCPEFRGEKNACVGRSVLNTWIQDFRGFIVLWNLSITNSYDRWTPKTFMNIIIEMLKWSIPNISVLYWTHSGPKVVGILRSQSGRYTEVLQLYVAISTGHYKCPNICHNITPCTDQDDDSNEEVGEEKVSQQNEGDCEKLTACEAQLS